jgi:hypothetical protein
MRLQSSQNVGEHVFVGDHGSTYARFKRAVKAGSVLNAESAARDLKTVTLADALALVCLYAAKNDRKFEPAARRWLVRLLEEKHPSLDEAKVAAEWLSLLTGDDADLAAGSLAQFVYR